jgi:hypothetical protein
MCGFVSDQGFATTLPVEQNQALRRDMRLWVEVAVSSGG